MADSTNNVTIRLNIAAVDRSGVQGITRDVSALTDALEGASKQFKATFAQWQDLHTKERQLGRLNDADAQRKAQLESVIVAQRGRELLQRAKQMGAEAGAVGGLSPLTPVGGTPGRPVPGITSGQQRLVEELGAGGGGGAGQAVKPPSVLQTIQANLLRVQRERAALPPGEEMRAHQLMQQEDRLRAHVERLQPTIRTTPPSGTVTPPATITPPTLPTTPVPPTRPAATTPPVPTPPAEPPPAPAMTRLHWDALQARREAMEGQLERLKTRRDALPRDNDFGRWKLDEETKALRTRLDRVRAEQATVPTRPLPEVEPPPTPRRPPRPPNEPPDDDDRWRGQGRYAASRAMQVGAQLTAPLGVHWGGMTQMGSQAGGAAGSGIGKMFGGAGGAMLGGFVGGAAGIFAGLALDRVIDKATAALDRYEQRLRGVVQISSSLNVLYEQTNASIDAMRDKYSFLASESIEALQGIGQSIASPQEADLAGAVRFSKAFGVAPGVAGGMQGQLRRLTAGGATLGDIALAQSMRPARPGMSDISAGQFVQQSLGIAGAGGTSLPVMSGDMAGRLTEFIGMMGQKYRGQQASVFERMSQGMNTPTSTPFEMMRERAITRLANRLPNGMLKIGEGEDAQMVDLKTLRGRRQAKESASVSPQVMEEYFRVGEEFGGNVPGMGDEFAQQMLLPNMNVSEFRRFQRERKNLGPGGLTRLGDKISRTGTATEEALIASLPEQFKNLTDVNARLEKALEPVASSMLNMRTSLEKYTADTVAAIQNLLNNGFTPLKDATGSMGRAMSTLEGSIVTLTSLLMTAGNPLGGVIGGVVSGFVPAPGPWAPGMNPGVQPQRTQ